MPFLSRATEALARKTSRRGFVRRSADVAFGALIGAASGTLGKAGGAIAAGPTVCAFPGQPCPCEGCLHTGVCGKPCRIMTQFYAAGCWVSYDDQAQRDVTCCDCDCNGFQNVEICGCASDYHNDHRNCP
jgi:hypothetical protein